MIALPDVNQSVGVYVVEWETELYSRIEDTNDGSLTIATPSDGRAERPLPRGAVVYIDWICERGVVRVRGVVSEFVRIPIPGTLVVVDGEPEVHQRRNYVRASAHLDVIASPIRGRKDDPRPADIKGTTSDMSGGGMRVRFQGFDADVNERLSLVVMMPDETTIEVVGKITRRMPPDTYCIEFDEIDQRAQERVVRLVFDRLRNRGGKAA